MGREWALLTKLPLGMRLITHSHSTRPDGQPACAVLGESTRKGK
jgi:hypothetical protein